MVSCGVACVRCRKELLTIKLAQRQVLQIAASVDGGKAWCEEMAQQLNDGTMQENELTQAKQDFLQKATAVAICIQAHRQRAIDSQMDIYTQV